MKKLALAALALATVGSISAQAPSQDNLLKAMHDEIGRAAKLTLANLEAPYFVEYVVAEQEDFQVTATLGGLLSRRHDRFRLPSVKIRVGDYKFDNTNYVGSSFNFGSRYDLERFPLEDNYPLLRRYLWLIVELETVALRFFNVYGPRQDPSSPYSGVISLFMRAILDRRAPTIFGDGEQTRDWTYVEDVAALCVKAASAPEVAGNMYNAGNGGRVSLNEVWSLLQKIEGCALAPKYGPPREGDVRDSQADVTAAKRDLCHDPQFTVEQGLRRTLDWYRSQ